MGEHYRYTAEGRRAVKTHLLAGRTGAMRQVRYLPGLEDRLTTCARGATARLQVAEVGNARINRDAADRRTSGGLQVRFTLSDRIGSAVTEVDGNGMLLSREVYYPFGGTAVWTTRNPTVASCKTRRYSGKERDVTGLVYYGFRYYVPWLMRWLNPDPAGNVDGLNLLCMVKNNPLTCTDPDGRMVEDEAGPSSSAVIDYQALNIIGRLADYPYIKLNKKTDTFYSRANDIEQHVVNTLNQQDGTGHLKVMREGGIKGKNSGLFAYIFKKHKEQGSYAISFGGTTAGEHSSGNTAVRWIRNLISNVAQVGADIQNMRGKIPRAYQQADEIVSTLYKSIPSGSKVLLTGHSLGAALAEYAGGRNFNKDAPESMEIVGFSPAMLGEDTIDAIRDSQSYDLQALQSRTTLYTIVGDIVPTTKSRGGGHLVTPTELLPNSQMEASFLKNIAVHTQALHQISDSARISQLSHPPLRRL
jgi:RHS repeat-associated protein